MEKEEKLLTADKDWFEIWNCPFFFKLDPEAKTVGVALTEDGPQALPQNQFSCHQSHLMAAFLQTILKQLNKVVNLTILILNF